jgi:hypothetical protein
MSTVSSLPLGGRTADRLEVRNPHLFVFARHHDSAGSSFECVQVSPGHVKSDTGVNFRLLLRRGHAPLRLPVDVIGRKPFGGESLEFGEMLVISERNLYRKLNEQGLLGRAADHGFGFDHRGDAGRAHKLAEDGGGFRGLAQIHAAVNAVRNP